MNSPPGTSEIIDLLTRLRGQVREFAAREDALRQNFRLRAGAESKTASLALEEEATRLAEALANAEADVSAARGRIEARAGKRVARITEAHRNSRKRGLDLISEREGRQKYALQKRALEAGRQRDADLAAASVRLEEYRQQLSESQAQFAALEERAKNYLRGVGAFRRALSSTTELPEANPAMDEHELLVSLGELQSNTETALRQFRRNLFLRVFAVFPLWTALGGVALAFVAALLLLPFYAIPVVSKSQIEVALGVAALVLILAYALSRRAGRSHADTIARNLAHARHWHGVALAKAEETHRHDRERTSADWERTNQALDDAWHQALEEAERARTSQPGLVDQKKVRALETNSIIRSRALADLETRHASTVEQLQTTAKARKNVLVDRREGCVRELEGEFKQSLAAVETEWLKHAQPIQNEIRTLTNWTAKLFPDWNNPSWQTWSPPRVFERVASFGRLEVDLRALAGVPLPETLGHSPDWSQITVPLLLKYPEEGSLLFETGTGGMKAAIDAINCVIFRLLAVSPPGQINFTIIDPVGLGQNFAALMHLADFEENQINGRIWTQPSQIEERLAELNEHMEKVIQMYLRNEFTTIADYNAQAGATAEKYHVVVVAGFPVNFSETATRRLLNIAGSGARCGVHLLLAWDTRQVPPHDFIADELRRNSLRLAWSGEAFQLAAASLAGVRIELDSAPPTDWITEFLRKVGENAKDANRVEVPFAQVAPAEVELWSEDTAEEIRVPIGISGAAKLQYLALGRGTRQHALVAGKTGSGKSNLFHVIITNLALWCSPDQVEFYLVDFKKGVEFKCYATRRLPHARVVAIESDREFGLSVLQRVDDELRRRGDLFRKQGVQEFATHRKAAGPESLPRLLLLIDEFQEFFTEEDRISQAAAVLLDRIVRQGRAFGIHALLGSQTLGGAYTLARATIGQMVIRVALQCNEADAYLIMDENNSAPRLLSRPGEGIYNDMAGRLEGNSPFQVVWFADSTRDCYLEKIRARADRDGLAERGPTVFEGNVPADIRENDLLWQSLRSLPTLPPVAPRVWLGAPNAIKGPTEAVFQRQGGSHLLIVGQDAESVLSLHVASLVSLAAQYPPGLVRLVLVESTAPATPERIFFDRTIAAIAAEVIRPKRHELTEVLRTLIQKEPEPTTAETSVTSGATFVLIFGLQDFKVFRQEDEFSFSPEKAEEGPSPAALFAELATEGPHHDVHLIVSVDSYNNVTRFLSRKLLGEFQMRVLFQMSASDSASLIDSPEASKLGFHRALLYNEREGYLEKFRPYALPGNDWLEEVATLRQRKS